MGTFENYESLKQKALNEINEELKGKKVVIHVGSATCENAAGANNVYDEFVKNIKKANRNDVYIKRVGCTGRCSLEPIVGVHFLDKDFVVYKNVDVKAASEIFDEHIQKNQIAQKHVLLTACEKIDPVLKEKSQEQRRLLSHPITHEFYEVFGDIPFYCQQSRIALRNSGLIDPLSVYDYIKFQGFSALAKVLEKESKHVVDEVTISNLRGRGGAGFPTGKKWQYAINNKETERYMICNADEGDPGAFMDRSMLESDPFSIIEGMIIAGYGIKAKKGFIYVRAEYPLAVERIQQSIEIARQHNLLGKNILGSGFDYDLEIRLGAGAFVCGEETALIHSIEGKRGQPRVRPPFPAEAGLWGKPTIINNVETLANLPVVFSFGGDEFNKIGSQKSGGTKVFAVSGKVKHTGLVEVPMGTSLKKIVFDICGGVPNNKKLKAIQTGGPAGGCIPLDHIETKADYEDITKIGSIMGSGGLIVLDEDDCMVSIAKFFMSFSQDESCGKCTPCREGTVRMLEILTRITDGHGEIEDLDKLERLGRLMQRASLCGLGRACANPVLSTLKFFRDEYEEHILEKKCKTKCCPNLIRYEVDKDNCVGCTLCAKNCPADAISGAPTKVHYIDQTKCIKCGRCYEVCKFNAIKRL